MIHTNPTACAANQEGIKKFSLYISSFSFKNLTKKKHFCKKCANFFEFFKDYRNVLSRNEALGVTRYQFYAKCGIIEPFLDHGSLWLDEEAI